jgi:hypothetical protein
MQVMTDAPNVSGCLSESVSAWQASGRTSELVDLALSSMALAVFSRAQKHREAAAVALSKYQRLLNISQLWISQVGSAKLDEADMDACLLAVSLMGRFEGVSYNVDDSQHLKKSFTRLKSWCHHDGAMAVLKAWYDNRRQGRNSASVIIKHTRRGIIKSCLMRNRPLPDWLLDGESFGEQNMELESDRIDVRILALRQAYLKLGHGVNATTVELLDEKAKGIDNALQELAGQLPALCSYQQHVITAPGSFPRKHFISPDVYSYQRPGYAAIWAQYFATRMLANTLRLRILDLSCSDLYGQKRTECHNVIKAMGDSLACTIPFCLERFSFEQNETDSILLNANTEITPYLVNTVVWPLSIAAGLKSINARQLSWFRCELAAIGRLIGDGVLESARTSEWDFI